MTPETLARAASRCLSAFAERLAGAASRDPALAPFAEEIAAVDRSRVQRGPLPRLAHPAMAHLETAVAAAPDGDVLTRAAVAAAGVLDWMPVYDGSDLGTGLSGGMLAAQMAGTYGCFASPRLAAGLFLLAPGLHYPVHTHEAEEIYYAISGRLTLQHGLDATPFTIGPGELSRTPPHRLHALTTGEVPVLLLYAWRGDLGAPLWLWQQQGADWYRSEWRRVPGESWKEHGRQPVSPEAWREALG